MESIPPLRPHTAAIYVMSSELLPTTYFQHSYNYYYYFYPLFLYYVPTNACRKHSCCTLFVQKTIIVVYSFSYVGVVAVSIQDKRINFPLFV